jgi:hypothetical protein
MMRESKGLSDFTSNGRFELNSYIMYLFDQCNKDAQSQVNRKLNWSNNSK